MTCTAVVLINVCNSNVLFIIFLKTIHHHHHHHHLFFNHKGCWGTIDDFATSFLRFSLFSIALWDLVNPRPHFLMLSSHLFLCLPCLLPPFIVPCKMVLARPDERETRPYHCSFVSLYDGQEVFVWADCLLDLGTDFLVGNIFTRC